MTATGLHALRSVTGRWYSEPHANVYGDSTIDVRQLELEGDMRGGTSGEMGW